MFLMDGGHAAAHWDERIGEIKGIMERHGCNIIRLVKWDDRRLAYSVQHSKRGAYVLCFYEAPSESNRRVERDVQLSDTLLRVLIIRREKMTTEEMLSYRVPSREANIIGENIVVVEEERAEPAAVADRPSRGGRRRDDEDSDSGSGDDN
jgi:small subunit ribosomal protein S6